MDIKGVTKWLRMIPTPGKLTIIVTVTLVLMGLFAIWRGVSRDHVQLVETEDQFPLIIHQTWQSYDVPEEFSDWVRSWQKYNPHWEYWFWSRVEIDALIRDRYPDFKKISDNFDQEIRRADSIRYMLLHEVGGFYADLDMECLQPLTSLAKTYSCLLSEENYEHVNLVYHRRDPVVMNCVMGCRPGHPFYEAVVDRLPSRSHVVDVINGTGPFFLTSMFQEYQRRPNTAIADHVHLLPPRFLLPVPDLRSLRGLKLCDKLEVLLKQDLSHDKFPSAVNYLLNPSLDMDQLEREAEICRKMNMINFAKPPPQALTTHHWVHSWDTRVKEMWAKKPTVHIKTLVPNVKLYSDVVSGKDTSRYYN